MGNTENTSEGSWTYSEELNVGNFQVEYRSGSEVCNTTPLMEVSCSAGYEQRSGGCVTIPAASTSPLQLVMGLGVGVVLALCVIILLVLIRKHPSRAKKIFLSFM